jgi:hypothetical protein
MLDIDKGGTLDVDGELLQAMQRLGQNIILQDLRMAMERVRAAVSQWPTVSCVCGGQYAFPALAACNGSNAYNKKLRVYMDKCACTKQYRATSHQRMMSRRVP